MFVFIFIMISLKKAKEGHASIIVPDEEKKPSKSSAFYNPRMALNRDFSMAVARSFFKGKKKVKVCEPFGATGIRAIRYALEVPGSLVYAGDVRRSSVELIKKNAGLNKARNIEVFHREAKELLTDRKYDLVDLDPFGTPAPFIGPALEGLKASGMLAATATDMMALCGVAPKQGTMMPKYSGACSLKTEYVHEIAVRLLLGFIARKSKRGIKPLLSLSTDHYIRVFVKFGKYVKRVGYVNHCFKCGKREVSKRKKKKCCCSALYKHAGPLWTGKLWDKKFCKSLNFENKLLDRMVEEANGKPLFYTTRELYRGKQIPKMEVVLKEWNATRTHFKLDGIRIKK